MKIVLVGGGASALICANLIKNYDATSEVFIVEKNDKLGKKMKMTGNGKCNLAPISDNANAYNNPHFVNQLFEEVSFGEYLKQLQDLGVPTKTIKNQGYYPLSENAPNVVSILTNSLVKKGVKIISGEVVEYDNKCIYLKDKKDSAPFDKIIFAIGGKSYANSGSNGVLFPIFKKHGYQVNELKPSLCPIKVKEGIKSLFGTRAHGALLLLEKGKVCYQEVGEVMFKKDAISGIAAMNASSYIAHHDGEYQISLNLLEKEYFEEFANNKNINVLDALSAYVQLPIAEYIIKKLKINGLDLFTKHADKIKNELANLTFTYDSLYDFDSAQVTAGGIDIKEIDPSFKSKKENNVYFIGEMLDVDGLCGGYNLRFAISSAIQCAKHIKD